MWRKRRNQNNVRHRKQRIPRVTARRVLAILWLLAVAAPLSSDDRIDIQVGLGGSHNTAYDTSVEYEDSLPLSLLLRLSASDDENSIDLLRVRYSVEVDTPPIVSFIPDSRSTRQPGRVDGDSPFPGPRVIERLEERRTRSTPGIRPSAGPLVRRPRQPPIDEVFDDVDWPVIEPGPRLPTFSGTFVSHTPCSEAFHTDEIDLYGHATPAAIRIEPGVLVPAGHTLTICAEVDYVYDDSVETSTAHERFDLAGFGGGR